MYFKASKQAVTEHTKEAFKRSQMQHSRFGAYFDKKFGTNLPSFGTILEV